MDECLDELNERSTYVVTVSFFDENGDPVTPSSATYRVDDEKHRTNLVPTTSIGSLTTAVDIEITSDENRIIRSRSAYEVRTVTVIWNYGGTKQGTGQYRYKVINLYGVLDVPSPSTSPSASASPSV